VVLNVFLSFYGVSEDYTIVKPRQSASSRQTARANAEEMFGKSNAHVIKNAAREDREDREIRKSVGKEGCAACGRQESSVAQGSQSTAEKFKACSKCNGIGRTVRYCSRFVVIVNISFQL
jgi:excinuclease UvrABC ATPase subunit